CPCPGPRRLRRGAPDRESTPPSSSRTALCCTLQTSFPGTPVARLRPERSISVARSGGFSRRRFGGLLLYRRGGPRRGALCRGALCRRCAFRMNRQAALHDQLHGAVDGNPHSAFVLIHPVVGGELLVLIFGELAKVGALVFFEARLRESLCVLMRYGAGVGPRGRHRAQGRLVRPFVTVEEAVHAEHDEIDGEAEQRQTCHKIKRTLRTQILMLVAVVTGHMLIQRQLIRHCLIRRRLIRAPVVSHAPAPKHPAPSRRKREPAAASSGYDRSMRSRFRPWRRGSRGLPA